MLWKIVQVLVVIPCLLTSGCKRERPAETGSAAQSGIAEDGALIKGKLSDLTIETKLVKVSGSEQWKITVVITNKGSEPFSYKGTSAEHADHCFVEIYDRDRNRAERFSELGPLVEYMRYDPEIGTVQGSWPPWWRAGVWLTIRPGEVIVNRAEWPSWDGLKSGTYDVRVGFPRVFNQRLAAEEEKRAREYVPGSAYVGDMDVTMPGERWVPYNPAIGINKTAFADREPWDVAIPVANPVYSNVVRIVIPPPSPGDEGAE